MANEIKFRPLTANEIKFRPLTANEIDCRVGNTVKKKDQNGKIVKDQYGNDVIKGFFLLLYKNARVDQIILDETFGAFNWQSKYYQVKNTMVCSVGVNINFEHPECEPIWVWKDNGGDDQTEMEQVKAELSDSFKRACFNWGIGRELYFSPKIYIEATEENTTRAYYSVKTIEYGENKRITRLVIVNDKTNQVVFLYGGKDKDTENGDLTPKNPIPSKNEPKGSIDKADLTLIQQLIGNFNREESRKKFYNWLDNTYGTMNVETLTLSQGRQVLNMLQGGKK